MDMTGPLYILNWTIQRSAWGEIQRASDFFMMMQAFRVSWLDGSYLSGHSPDPSHWARLFVNDFAPMNSTTVLDVGAFQRVGVA